jgi:hypothetical protein
MAFCGGKETEILYARSRGPYPIGIGGDDHRIASVESGVNGNCDGGVRRAEDQRLGKDQIAGGVPGGLSGMAGMATSSDSKTADTLASKFEQFPATPVPCHTLKLCSVAPGKTPCGSDGSVPEATRMPAFGVP